MKEQDLLGQWKGEEQEPFTGWDFSHPSPHVTLAVCGEEVEQAGLIIEYAEESTGKMTFSDVGAFVYYARAVPLGSSARLFGRALCNPTTELAQEWKAQL